MFAWITCIKGRWFSTLQKRMILQFPIRSKLITLLVLVILLVSLTLYVRVIPF